MDKMKCETESGVERNVDKIAAMFPQVVTEVKGEDGKITRAVKWDVLKELLSGEYVEGGECYDFTWPGKRAAIAEAARPIRKTLRPCKAESKDWDTTENLYIEGDNLEVLKLLQESYLGKVKMIYIDPPYNTGNDFVYRDDFKIGCGEYAETTGELFENEETGETVRMFRNTEANGRFHSDWCSMMYARLAIARDLLADDGIILVSINDIEVYNLKNICDEIFGHQNHVATFVWKNKYGPGAFTKGIADLHEYILAYSKNRLESIEAPLSEEDIAKYKLVDSKFATRGGYITQPLATRSKDDRPNLVYPLIHNGVEIWPNKQWIWEKSRLLAAYKNDEIVIREDKGKFSVRFKQYLKDENGKMRNGKPLSLINVAFNQEGTKEVSELLGPGVFDFPKPINLIKHFLSFIINGDESQDAIILDFFSGAATSAHAVMQLNAEDGGKRKFIMVQWPEECPPDSEAAKAGYANICEIGKERIRRAGAKVVSDKWEVISKEEKARYGCKELSRADCLAEINGGGEGDLFAGQKTAEGGNVRAVGSNAAGGGVDSVEYRGGAGAELNKGVSAVSGDSAREHGGAGNATAVVRSSGIPCPYGHFGAHGQTSGSEQNAECPYKNTIHCPLTTKHCPDVGFRVFKVADSNMKDVYFSAAEYKQESLDDFITNIKEDRTDLDLLYGCLLEWGVELSLPHTSEAIDGVTVHTVNNGDLIACFDPNIPESAIRAIAKRQPLRAVFRDSSFASAPQKINVEEIFKLLSPTTTIKVI